MSHPKAARRLEPRRSLQLSRVSESGFLREGTRLRRVGGARQARAGKERRACLVDPRRSLAGIACRSARRRPRRRHLLSGPLYPVVDSKARDPLEFTDVVGDEDKTERARMPCNHPIVWTDGPSRSGELGPKLSEMRGGRPVERQYFKVCRQPLDVRQVPFRGGRLLGTVYQLAKGDGRYRHLSGVSQSFECIHGISRSSR